MTIPPPPPPVAPGVPDFLAYLFPQKSKNVRRASQVSRRTRQREVTAYQRTYGGTKRQAQRRTASMRRRGYVPKVTQPERATPQQVERAQQYQARSARAQQQPVSARVVLTFDYAGRVQAPYAILRSMPVNDLRYASGSNGKAEKFHGYLSSEQYTSSYDAVYTRASVDFNGGNFQAKVDRMTRDELIAWLQISYADYVAEAIARTRQWIDNGKIRGQEPIFWWYH